MKLVDLTFFVELGAALEAAGKVSSDGALFDAYFGFYRLRNALEKLSNGEHARLSATSHDLAELRTALINFDRRHFRDVQGNFKVPDEAQRSPFEIQEIVGKVSQFQTVLVADLRTAAAFSVVRAGIFDVNLLVNSAHRALGVEVIKTLAPETLSELDASGKCLAFNLPTASGFHAMRAVERVIKSYLALFMPTEEISKMHNWGKYLAALEKIASSDATPKPSTEAIALIRHIKDIYRNPVIHPERVLTADEAATLFHSTLAAINRIAIELGGGQKALPGIFDALRIGPGAAILTGQAA